MTKKNLSRLKKQDNMHFFLIFDYVIGNPEVADLSFQDL